MQMIYNNKNMVIYVNKKSKEFSAKEGLRQKITPSSITFMDGIIKTWKTQKMHIGFCKLQKI